LAAGLPASNRNPDFGTAGRPFSAPSMASARVSLAGPEMPPAARISTAAGWPTGPVTTLSIQ
jgi:hypothetical protein